MDSLPTGTRGEGKSIHASPASWPTSTGRAWRISVKEDLEQEQGRRGPTGERSGLMDQKVHSPTRSGSVTCRTGTALLVLVSKDRRAHPGFAKANVNSAPRCWAGRTGCLCKGLQP